MSFAAAQVLQHLVAERDLHVWVHPVPPVLDETRHIVMPFNDLMRRRVGSPAAHPPLPINAALGTAPCAARLEQEGFCCGRIPPPDTPCMLSRDDYASPSRCHTSSQRWCPRPAQMQEPTLRSPRLHWLDVAEGFLTADGSSLKPELRFDGTHMAPAFLDYVAAKLNEVQEQT